MPLESILGSLRSGSRVGAFLLCGIRGGTGPPATPLRGAIRAPQGVQVARLRGHVRRSTRSRGIGRSLALAAAVEAWRFSRISGRGRAEYPRGPSHVSLPAAARPG